MQKAGDEPTIPTGYVATMGGVPADQAPASRHVTQQTGQESYPAGVYSDLASDVCAPSGNDEAWDARPDPDFTAWLDLTLPSLDLGFPMDSVSRRSSIMDPDQLVVGLDKLVKADL